MLSDEQKAMLAKPLSSQHVKQRTQSGRVLSYVEGWHAIAEANRIFGFDGWTRETLEIKHVAERERPIGKDGGRGWGVSYIARVRVVVNGVTREGVGAGHGIDRDLGLAHESAIKEAETDAMKRALMTFGNPFGLALYDKTQANVSDDAPEGDEPSSSRLMADGVIAAIRAAGSEIALENYMRKPETKKLINALDEEDFQRVVSAGKDRRASLHPMAAG